MTAVMEGDRSSPALHLHLDSVHPMCANSRDVRFIDVSENYSTETPLQCRFELHSGSGLPHPNDSVGLTQVGWRSADDILAEVPVSSLLDSAEVYEDYVRYNATFGADVILSNDGEFYQFCYISFASDSQSSAEPSSQSESVPSAAGGGDGCSQQILAVSSQIFQFTDDDFVLIQPSLVIIPDGYDVAVSANTSASSLQTCVSKESKEKPAANPMLKKCDVCEEDEESVAVARCEDCEEYLCERCCKCHRKQKATASHKIETIDEYGTSAITRDWSLFVPLRGALVQPLLSQNTLNVANIATVGASTELNEKDKSNSIGQFKETALSEVMQGITIPLQKTGPGTSGNDNDEFGSSPISCNTSASLIEDQKTSLQTTIAKTVEANFVTDGDRTTVVASGKEKDSITAKTDPAGDESNDMSTNTAVGEEAEIGEDVKGVKHSDDQNVSYLVPQVEQSNTTAYPNVEGVGNVAAYLQVLEAEMVTANLQVEEQANVTASIQIEELENVTANPQVEEGINVTANTQIEEQANVTTNTQVGEGIDISASTQIEEQANVIENPQGEEQASVIADAQIEEEVNVTANPQVEEGTNVAASPHVEEQTNVAASQQVEEEVNCLNVDESPVQQPKDDKTFVNVGKNPVTQVEKEAKVTNVSIDLIPQLEEEPRGARGSASIIVPHVEEEPHSYVIVDGKDIAEHLEVTTVNTVIALHSPASAKQDAPGQNADEKCTVDLQSSTGLVEPGEEKKSSHESESTESEGENTDDDAEKEEDDDETTTESEIVQGVAAASGNDHGDYKDVSKNIIKPVGTKTPTSTALKFRTSNVRNTGTKESIKERKKNSTETPSQGDPSKLSKKDVETRQRKKTKKEIKGSELPNRQPTCGLTQCGENLHTASQVISEDLKNSSQVEPVKGKVGLFKRGRRLLRKVLHLKTSKNKGDAQEMRIFQAHYDSKGQAEVNFLAAGQAGSQADDISMQYVVLPRYSAMEHSVDSSIEDPKPDELTYNQPAVGQTASHTRVVFHVALSPLFEFNVAEDVAFVVINDDKFRMTLEKRLTDDLVVMYCDLLFSTMQLSSGVGSVKYHYEIQQFGDYISEEHIAEIYSCRQLDVRGHENVWHQHDGVASPAMVEQSAVTKWWNGEKKQHMKHSTTVGLAAIPSWNRYFSTDAEKQYPAEAMLQRISNTCHCIETSFLDFNGCPIGVELRSKVLSNYVGHAADILGMNIATTNSTSLCTRYDERAAVILASAVTIVAICMRNHLFETMVKFSDTLCVGLLVVPDPVGHTCSAYQKLVDYHFKASKEYLRQWLLSFVNCVSCEKFIQPLWLLAVPLVHFVCNDSWPFHRPLTVYRHNDFHPTWWGISQFEAAVVVLKTFKKLPIASYHDHLVPLFQVDQLLPRTVATVLHDISKEEVKLLMKKLPIEVQLATLYYLVKTNKEKMISLLSISSLLEFLFPKPVHELFKAEIPHRKSPEFEPCAQNAIDLCGISVDLLNIACDEVYSIRFSEIVVIVITVTFSAISKLEKFCIESNGLRNSGGQQDIVDQFFERLSDSVLEWHDKVIVRKFNSVELQLMDELLVTTILVERLKRPWIENLLSLLTSRLASMSPEDIISLYASEDFGKYSCLEIETSIFSAACDAVEKLDQQSIERLLDQKDTWGTNKMGMLISKMFTKFWSQAGDNTDTGILKHLLTWKPFAKFLSIILGNGSVVNKMELSSDCQQHAEKVVAIFKETITNLADGSISFDLLKLLEGVDIPYLVLLLKIVDPESTIISFKKHSKIKKETVLDTLLQWRVAEKKEYELLLSRLQHLMDFSRSCKNPELLELRKKLPQYDGSKNKKVSDVCTPNLLSKRFFLPSTSINDTHSYQPSITCFNISRSTINILEQLSQKSRSLVFQNLWEHSCALVGDNGDLRQDSIQSAEEDESETEILQELFKDANTVIKSDHDEEQAASSPTIDIENGYDIVIKNIWDYTLKKWDSYCTSLKSGNITIEEVDRVFKSFDNQYSTIEREVKLMCLEEEICEQRLKQIRFYHKCTRYMRGTEVVLLAAEHLGLAGDVSDLKTFLAVMSDVKTGTLGAISDSVLRNVISLEEIDDARANCLQIFITNAELTAWLKHNLPAEQYMLLLPCVDIDPSEIEMKKLITLALTNAEGQGDFEVEQVRCLECAVNGYKSLIYDVKPGCSIQELLDSCKSVWKELSNDPKLPNKFADTARHLDWLDSIYSGDENALKNAQCINNNGVIEIGNLEASDGFMLGLGTQGIDNIIRLKFRKGESEELQHMSLQKLKDLQSKLMLIVGNNEEAQKHYQRFAAIMSAITSLGAVYLEICNAGCMLFQSWKAVFFCDCTRKFNISIMFGHESMDEPLRSHSDDIVEQISKLCAFLRYCYDQWMQNVDLQRNAYYYLNFYSAEQLMMLQTQLAILSLDSARVNTSIYLLLSCIKQHLTSAEVLECLNSSSKIIQEERVKKSTDGAGSKSDNYLVKKAEYIEALKKAGIQMIVIEHSLSECDPSSIKLGILWCMKNSKSVMEKSSKSEQTDLRADMTFASTRSKLLTDLKSTDSLFIQLNKLWLAFLKQTSTSVADYLSLQHVGCFLQELADVFQLILSIYMNGEGRKQPLPKPDEVLLCSPSTSADEVELFCRRARGDAELEGSNKIYCLAFADLLKMDVARQVAERLESYCYDITDLQFLVICCRENEFRSHLVSALNRRRVDFPIEELDEIRQYLKENFTVGNHVDMVPGYSSASVVDPENLSLRLIKSHRPGVGKTLKVRRLAKELKKKFPDCSSGPLVTITLHSRVIDQTAVLKTLLEHTMMPEEIIPRIFHIDIAHEVQEGVDYLLFNLLILGSVGAQNNYVWTRMPHDLYVIESMPLMMKETKNDARNNIPNQTHIVPVHQIFDLLPTMVCWSPVDSLHIMLDNKDAMRKKYPGWRKNELDQTMDLKKFQSTRIQLPYQTLQLYEQKADNLVHIDVTNIPGTPAECLQCLLCHCGTSDPSWAELFNFVSFLNEQLKCARQSSFCVRFEDTCTLPGFSNFVVQFMIRMSMDFATRSLVISENSANVSAKKRVHENEFADDMDKPKNVVQQYHMKRKWETSPHPYLFFNSDNNTFTFIDFNIKKTANLLGPRVTFDLVDPVTGGVIEESIMARDVVVGLKDNGVNLWENFDSLPRFEKIKKMCLIMGQPKPHDPDETYELTTDNVKKILAIHMRFRCHIPTIIMGETGCGKTRLIKFMCDLLLPEVSEDVSKNVPSGLPDGQKIQNMILMKVHGGVTEDDIIKTVWRAEKIAQQNRQICKEIAKECKEISPDIKTVLFFDEANATEAIGLIKEIMCDRTVHGKRLAKDSGLHFIAACNPYRMHSDEMIAKLAQAGLGYRTTDNQIQDKLGIIPMRHLVYRVQALPQSMLPLVWDFGQLSALTERLYIVQIVARCVKGNDELSYIEGLSECITEIISAAQEFMREKKNECSFVSLRDVDRLLNVMMWFYNHKDLIFTRMDKIYFSKLRQQSGRLRNTTKYVGVDHHVRSLILALGVCYYCRLDKERETFIKHIEGKFTGPCALPPAIATIADEISICQDVFLSCEVLTLDANIARNQALKENLFMMIISIELKIPLMLIGKPGSSKSLAKIIVSDAMQGNSARTDFFRQLKCVHILSYQCSPLSTSEGIVATFEQCAKLQKSRNLENYAAVVVLDEVGLAEDSPKMPLKALHSLLEDGCDTSKLSLVNEGVSVGCIGISNWALDPAKMNRGIFVQRGVPSLEELEQTARDICVVRTVRNHLEQLIRPLARGYSDLCANSKREFFGLRDFYSLIKMIAAFIRRSGQLPTKSELEHAILRNFDGLKSFSPLPFFNRHLENLNLASTSKDSQIKNDSRSLIEASLNGIEGLETESRYLLILTKNYAALGHLEQTLLSEKIKDTRIIFGSSFRCDQEYTQACCNINRIKMCMESGKCVILLNLDNLYESLYDALNQYYIRHGDKQFVDLGLGTQRVKVRVHKDFRLIVVAEEEEVYDKFPTPLINRLEKHILSTQTMLSSSQIEAAALLDDWAATFASPRKTSDMRNQKKLKTADVFIGYHPDAAACIILQISQEDSGLSTGQLVDRGKEVLLRSATPESVVRLTNSNLHVEADKLFWEYFVDQHRDSLRDLLEHEIGKRPEKEKSAFLQVTTHSLLITGNDARDIGQTLNIKEKNITLCTLQCFDSENQFCNLIRKVLDNDTMEEQLFLLQCASVDMSDSLLACARYNICNEFNQHADHNKDTPRGVVHVVFIIQLHRIAGGCFVGFQGGRWKSYHLDDLHIAKEPLPKLSYLKGKTIVEIFEDAVDGQVVDGDTDGDTPVEADEQKLGVDYLIRSCLQKAVESTVDTTAESSAFKMHRLHLLLTVLSEDRTDRRDLKSLMRILRNRIALLLKDKQASEANTVDHNAVMSSNWLINEVSTVDSVTRAGTFRRALWQHLQSTVTPLLAGIIAFCDTCANLKLFAEVNGSSEQRDNLWIYKMWLEMLEDPSAVPLKYRELIAPHGIPLSEFHIRNVGANNAFFQLSVPFSWIICHKITDIFQLSKSQVAAEMSYSICMQGGMHEFNRVATLLENTAIGRLLTNWGDLHSHELVLLYIRDFAQMVYCPTSKTPKEELELVIGDITNSLQCSIRAEQCSILQVLSQIHIVYEEVLRQRLQLISQFNRVWPTPSGESLAAIQTPKFLDLRVAQFILDHLLDDADKIEDNADNPTKIFKRQQDFVDKVKQIQPVLTRLMENACKQNTTNDRRDDAIKCRHLWNKLCAVQLLVQHICLSGDIPQELTAYKSSLLLRFLGDDADFQTERSVAELKEFLQASHDAASEHFRKGQCRGCTESVTNSKIFWADPLPCGHQFCASCFENLLTKGVCSQADCNLPFSADTISTAICAKTKEMLAYEKYARRYNSFLLEVVHSLCFARGSPPDTGVIQKLILYIIQESKTEPNQQSLFLEIGDPFLNIRSFLLHLLLQSSLEDIRRHFDQHFVKLLVSGEFQQMLDLSLLCIQCLEDHYRINKAAIDIGSTELEYTQKMFMEAISSIHDRASLDLKLTRLETIAKLRFTIEQAVIWIDDNQENDNDSRKVHFIQELTRLLDIDSKWPRQYLVKLIAREYGMEGYQALVANPDLNWIMFSESDLTPDRFIVCGSDYAKVREDVAVATHGDCTRLSHTLQIITANDSVKEHMFLLALFRKITLQYKKQELCRKSQVLAFGPLLQFCQASQFMQHKVIAEQLIKNNLPGSLKISRSTQDIVITELLIHAYIVWSMLRGSVLHKPFIDLMANPASMEDSFFPTMPYDELAETIMALGLQQELAGEGWGPTMYMCPNRHPYVIGECGQPMEVRPCMVCGLPIGGSEHVLVPGNAVITSRDDNTTCGHCLGAPDSSHDPPPGVRLLTRTENSIMRLLLHISMLLGTTTKVEVIHGFITPEVGVKNVESFLLSHIESDLEIIKRTIDKGKDDVILFIHILLDRLITINVDATVQSPSVVDLKSQAGRQKWEKDYAAAFITPRLLELEADLELANSHLLTDNAQFGNNPVLQLIQEADIEATNAVVDFTRIEHIPAVWRYRTPISLEHVKSKFDEALSLSSADGYPVLKLFLDKESKLRLLRFLPNIIELQKLLIQHFGHKINSQEASRMPVGSLSLNMFMGLTEDGNDFSEAWNAVRQESCLLAFGKDISDLSMQFESFKIIYNVLSNILYDNFVEIEVGNSYCKPLPKEYKDLAIDKDICVAMLMPSKAGVGLCSIALVSYLCGVQEDFMVEYTKLRKPRIETLERVSEITESQLISFNPERDLIQLLLGNCNYSAKPNRKGMAIEYDFKGLERQIEDRLILGRPNIDVKKLKPLLMPYRQNSTTVTKLIELRRMIPQESMLAISKHELEEELKNNSSEMNEMLARLDIAIGYLPAISDNPNESLHDFMKDTLKLDDGLTNVKTMLLCVKHVESLWLFLSHLQAKHMAALGQDSFYGLHKVYRADIPTNSKESAKQFLCGTNLSAFMTALFDYIQFRLTTSDDPLMEDYCPADYRLGDYLEEHLKCRPGEFVLATGTIPDDIRVKHCVKMWELAWEMSNPQGIKVSTNKFLI